MDLTRRQALRRGALAVGAGLAGCLSDDASTDLPTSTLSNDGATAEETPSTNTARTDSPAATAERTPTSDPQNADDETVATTTTQSGVTWRFDLGADVGAAPAVADGTLYVGGYRETDGTPTPGGEAGGPSTTLRGIGLDDGDERFRTDVGAPVQAQPRVVDDRVYVVRGYRGLHGQDYQLRAVSTDGQSLWRHEAGSLHFLSVLGADETGVVVGENDDNLGQGNEETVALAPDGTGQWRRETTDVYDGTVETGAAYVSDFRRRVRAFDRASGEEQWTVERDSLARHPTATDDGLLAAGSVVFALERATGDVRWTFEESPPVGLFADDGLAFVPTEGGRLVALDVGDGSEVWAIQRSDDTPSAVGDDTVYVGRENGTLAAAERATGEELWTADVGQARGFHPTDDRVYVSRDGAVVALDPADGSRVGSVAVEGDPQWVVSGDSRDAVVTPGGRVYGLAL